MKYSQVIADLAAFRGISYEEAAVQLFRDMLVDATEAKMLGQKHFEIMDKDVPEFEVAAVAAPTYVEEERRRQLIDETERKMTDTGLAEKLSAAVGVPREFLFGVKDK
jgi:hypothetical protein